jgi:hypothetical protein
MELKTNNYGKIRLLNIHIEIFIKIFKYKQSKLAILQNR